MQKHTKIYMDYFDYGIEDFIPCEACGKTAVDIHHIKGRGKGKDVIGNLIALCRKHHSMAHNEIPKDEIQLIHNYFIGGDRRIFLK